MKKSTLIIALFLLNICSVFAQNKAKNTIVIVHGAWSSAADWGNVIATLKSDGDEVIAVNLPAHGTDNTPISTISLQGYVDYVKKAIGSKRNIILVAHSFGGIVASEVAEQLPAQIKKLVYVAAYVPKNGESLLSLANTDSTAHIGKYLRPDEKAGTAGIAKEGIVDVFVADAPKQVQDYLEAHLKVEPLAPLATPVTLTSANFGSIPKVYVHSLNDHVIGYPLQLRMVQGAGINRYYAVPSSHTPFISLPNIIAAIIDTEAK